MWLLTWHTIRIRAAELIMYQREQGNLKDMVPRKLITWHPREVAEIQGLSPFWATAFIPNQYKDKSPPLYNNEPLLLLHCSSPPPPPFFSFSGDLVRTAHVMSYSAVGVNHAFSALSFIGFLMVCIPIPWHLECKLSFTVCSNKNAYSFFNSMERRNLSIHDVDWISPLDLLC